MMIPLELVHLDHASNLSAGMFGRPVNLPSQVMFIGRVLDKRFTVDWIEGAFRHALIEEADEDHGLVAAVGPVNFRGDWTSLVTDDGRTNGLLVMQDNALYIRAEAPQRRRLNPIEVARFAPSKGPQLEAGTGFSRWEAYVLHNDTEIVLWSHPPQAG